MKRSATTSVSKLQQQDDDASLLSNYNYGFINLPSNCRVLSMDIEGEQDLSNCHKDDIVNLSNAAATMNMIYVVDQAPYDMIVYTNKNERDGYVLHEYCMVFQFPAGTRLKYDSFALVLEINKLRITPSSIIGYFDEKKKRTTVSFMMSSVKNPILILESILIHQHISTVLTSTDHDGLSSKNTFEEASVTRKRSKKTDIKYEKICEK